MTKRNVRPTVIIIGAGALGKCLAALLVGKADVTLCERNASLPSLRSVKIDVLIFATKIMDLRSAVVSAAELKPRYVFLPQNGIFDFVWVKKFFKKAFICRGVTTMACQNTGPTEVTLFYRGDICIGGKGASGLAGLFRKCGVEAKAYQETDGLVWSKLIFSAVMNPLPVFTGRGYDVLKADADVWNLVRKAVDEGRAVAQRLGVRLVFDPLRLIERVRNGDLAGIAHRGTLFQDTAAGRVTELDFITGALVRHARKAGIKTPALDSILHKAKLAGA